MEQSNYRKDVIFLKLQDMRNEILEIISRLQDLDKRAANLMNMLNIIKEIRDASRERE